MKTISFARCQWHFCSRAVWYNFIIAVLYWSIWGVTKELFTLTFTTVAWGSEQHGSIHCQHSSAEIPHTAGGRRDADCYSNGLKVFQVQRLRCLMCTSVWGLFSALLAHLAPALHGCWTATCWNGDTCSFKVLRVTLWTFATSHSLQDCILLWFVTFR